MKKLLALLILSLFTISLASAASTCLTINSKNTPDYLKEIPTLNGQLATCTILIPQTANSLVTDGNVLVTINMNDGSTENFYVTIQGGKVSSFNSGSTATYTNEAILSESTMDKILQATNGADEILKGINNGDIIIKPATIVGKIKWFFAKFFLPTSAPTQGTGTVGNVPAGPTGKPDNCDETYLPGHREYANNKALWDSYSADTDKVCQSQYGRGTPSPCIHSIQLSINGNPYYLCWYNE